MESKFEKIFSPISLFAINIAIILLAEYTGGGRYFSDTGLIHIITIFFVLLGVARLFHHYYSSDPILERFLRAASLALVTFAFSDVIGLIPTPNSGVAFANTLNFFLISILIIAMGTEFIIKIVERRSYTFTWILSIAIAGILGWVFILFHNQQLADFGPQDKTLYLYAAAMIVTGTFGAFRLYTLKKMIPIASEFLDHLMGSFIIISASIVPSIFYKLAEINLGIPRYQLDYLSHFAYYAGLSIMFLAFTKLSQLSGLYQQQKEAKS